MVNQSWCYALLSACLLSQPVFAAQREANPNGKAIAKLQAMVQDITAERDRFKTESAKLTADLEQAKIEASKLSEQIVQLEQEKTTALAIGDKLTGELSAQKSTTQAVEGQLLSTSKQLRESQAQYQALLQANQTLTGEHQRLQQTQKTTSTELASCENKNTKLYETTKTMIEHYRDEKTKDVLDKLVELEPLFKFDDIEVENLLQDYQDNINKQKYAKHTP